MSKPANPIVARAVAAALISTIAVPTVGFAQEQGQDAAALDEVVVTAQKREENLSDVPLAVSVVTADTLERAAVFNAESLTNLVPSLSFRKGTSNVNSSLVIRGVGTNTFSAAVEPSVGTVLDGVVLARPGMAFSDFLDLQRVEVLRGPQGTLFGKNASAGVVQFVTKDPTATPEGYVEALVAEGNEYRVRGSWSGPLNERWGARVSAFYGQYDGIGTNVFSGQDVNGYERFGARVKLVGDVTDALTLRIGLDYTKAEDNCCADIIGFVDPTQARNTRVLLPSLAPVVPNDSNRNVDNDLEPLTEDENWGISLQADWDFGAAVLTSITAYRGWDNAENRDGDFRSDAPTWTNASVPAGDTRLHDVGDLSFNQFSQELRITSPADQFVEYVAGLFYYSTEQENFFQRRIRQCTASTLPALANGNVPCNASSTFVDQTGTANFTTEFTNWALFGNVTLNFTDSFRGLFGLRYTDDEVEYRFQRVSTAAAAVAGIQPGFSNPQVAGVPVPPPLPAPQPFAPVISQDNVSGRVGVQFDISEDIMTYATYTKGYKGPGFNLFFNMNPVNTAPIAEEDVKAWEIGAKTQWFDRRLAANLAIFNAKYEGFQANQFVQVAGVTVSTLTNAGDVRTQGAELELFAEPVDGLNLTASVAYTDAEVTRSACNPAVLTAAQLLSCNARTGLQLSFSPYLKSAVTADWRLPVSDGLPVNLNVNTSWTYQSEVNYDLERNPVANQGAYGLVDLGFSVSDKDDRWRVTALVKNLADREYVSLKVVEGGTAVNGIPTGGAFVRNQIARDANRYWQLSVRYNFGQ